MPCSSYSILKVPSSFALRTVASAQKPCGEARHREPILKRGIFKLFVSVMSVLLSISLNTSFLFRIHSPATSGRLSPAIDLAETLGNPILDLFLGCIPAWTQGALAHFLTNSFNL